MSYIGWTVVAMLGYGVTAVFLKLAMRGMPPLVTLVVGNSILVLAGMGLILYRGESFFAHLTASRHLLLLGLAGLALSVSIASFYTALSRGEASVVVPIFAMYFAVTVIVGCVFLGEEITLTKLLGVALAGGAIYLLTR